MNMNKVLVVARDSGHYRAVSRQRSPLLPPAQAHCTTFQCWESSMESMSNVIESPELPSKLPLRTGSLQNAAGFDVGDVKVDEKAHLNVAHTCCGVVTNHPSCRYELKECFPCFFNPFNYLLKDRLPCVKFLGLSDCFNWLVMFFSWAFKKANFPALRLPNAYGFNTGLSDAIAGLTVGIMVVPQALAYAKIAGLPIEVSAEIPVCSEHAVSIHLLHAILLVNSKQHLPSVGSFSFYISAFFVCDSKSNMPILVIAC